MLRCSGGVGKLDWSCGAAGVVQGKVAVEGFATDVAEG